MGGISGAPENLLDAGAQAFHPAVGAPYPLPVQSIPHQLFYTNPCPAVPPPPLAMPVPLPAMALALPGYSLPTTTPVADGPSRRAVMLSLVPPHAQEADVAQAMAPFGAIRYVDASAAASEGVATVHFFDIRAAELAVARVREQHIRQQSRLGQLYAAATAWPPPPPPQPWGWPGHDDACGLVLGQAVWARFASGADLDGDNRGSLVVLSPLPGGVTLADLRQVFQAFGTHERHRPTEPTNQPFRFPTLVSCVSCSKLYCPNPNLVLFAGDLMDVRESAQRPSHKFVDFFDTRDAARALAELNGRERFGRRLVIEFTRPSSGSGSLR
jgi:hypothetical protein